MVLTTDLERIEEKMEKIEYQLKRIADLLEARFGAV
jgi:hypothetical protein